MPGGIVIPVLRQLRARLNRLRERELAVGLKRLPDLTPAQRAAVEQLSHALVKEFMRAPSARLRAAAVSGEGSDVVQAARYLFALDDGQQSRDVRAA
jgi:glutamyl-tRNA reductase